MKKKYSIGLKSLLIIIAAIIIVSVFGFDYVTKFVLQKVLFTPYNIVGIIMTLATRCGIYINKRQGHWLKKTITWIFGVSAALSFVCTIMSWMKIDIWSYLLNNVLRPAVVSIWTVLAWCIIALISFLLLCLMIYCIIKIVCQIKERRASQKSCEEPKAILTENEEKINQHNAEFVLADVADNQHEITNESQEEFPAAIDEQHKHHNTTTAKDMVFLKQDEILSEDDELKISENKCPLCGWYLKKRTNRQTGEQFRGCSNYYYHNCTFTISDEEYLRIYKKYKN